MPGDGCSTSCECESNPCSVTASPQVNLASVVAGLLPGDTLTLASGTYKGSGVCGWTLPFGAGADDSPITVRGAGNGALPIVDCDNAGPVFLHALAGVHLRLERIHFTHAYRSGGGGGVLSAELGSIIVVTSCRVTAVSTDRQGGAILVRDSNSTLLIHDSHFEENTAEDAGGSLAILDGVQTTLTDSVFTRCSASSNGGAIYITRSCTVVMEHMLFSLNSGSSGAAIMVKDNCTVLRILKSQYSSVFTV